MQRSEGRKQYHLGTVYSTFWPGWFFRASDESPTRPRRITIAPARGGREYGMHPAQKNAARTGGVCNEIRN